MQDLKVIGVENGALVAVGDDGERFRIAIDEVLQSKVRQFRQETPTTAAKLSPREVQAHIRSGMSAEDVAAVTGSPIEYILRFEGPIVAEREHIVASALSVPVHTSVETDPLGEGDSFGAVIRERLASLGVTGERWASWKDSEAGWILKLEFTADLIDHDARWGYDVRKHALAPLNSEATTLSQAGELRGALIPRLRAVIPRDSEPDESRFDSGAFTFAEPQSDQIGPDTAPFLESLGYGRTVTSANNSIAVNAIKRADDETPRDLHQTADLLEALRRRRGEREAANYEAGPTDDVAGETAEIPAETPAEAPMRIVEEPFDIFTIPSDGAPAPAPAETASIASSSTSTASQQLSGPSSTGPSSTGSQPRAGKKGRASMPSWDEIVFGARTDDDLA
ncbi:septation protein SepH [Leifsonia poae]|uniref:septation protein SepH n=1 Tax=Leifsonia poae TaxID=110933 RepID=UPI001CBD74A9|nr:septation protein SepH [Leifsonia poae]